jgi:hypothetical protein
MRTVVPDHKVSRVDVCEDLLGPEVFNALDEQTRKIADQHHVHRHRIVPDDNDRGSTIYLGSFQSTVLGRVYEKGKQILHDPAKAREVEPPPGYESVQALQSWVRCEIQIKPKGPAKAALASATPDALWNCSRWSQDLYAAVGGVPGDRIKVGTVWRANDNDRALKAMVRQYTRPLLALKEQVGDWACVGLTLGEMLKALGSGGE